MIAVHGRPKVWPRCQLCGHTRAQHLTTDTGCWAENVPGGLLCGCSLYLPEEDENVDGPDEQSARVASPVPTPRRRTGPYIPPVRERAVSRG